MVKKETVKKDKVESKYDSAADMAIINRMHEKENVKVVSVKPVAVPIEEPIEEPKKKVK